MQNSENCEKYYNAMDAQCALNNNKSHTVRRATANKTKSYRFEKSKSHYNVTILIHFISIMVSSSSDRKEVQRRRMHTLSNSHGFFFWIKS